MHILYNRLLDIITHFEKNSSDSTYRLSFVIVPLELGIALICIARQHICNKSKPFFPQWGTCNIISAPHLRKCCVSQTGDWASLVLLDGLAIDLHHKILYTPAEKLLLTGGLLLKTHLKEGCNGNSNGVVKSWINRCVHCVKL